MQRRPSIRAEVVSALQDGFGGQARIERKPRETRVFPDGLDEPIVVRAAPRQGSGRGRGRFGGIDVPASYPDEIVAGIRLDVQAVLAER